MTKKKNGLVGRQTILFRDPVINLVFVHLGREERDGLLVSVLVPLKQYRADANVGCVALDVEMFLEIRMNQDRRSRQGQLHFIHFLCAAGD